MVRDLATFSQRNVSGGHGGRGPAFDLPVQVDAAPDFDAQAAVIVVACVLADVVGRCRLSVGRRNCAASLR